MITRVSNYADLIACRTKDSQTILVNPNDEYISRSIMMMGEWEPHIRTILSKFVKPGMHVMDIGANIGTHTLLISKLVGDEGKVYAFEPCKLNHDILFQNLVINKCKNTVLYKYGLGEKKSEMYIESRWTQSQKKDNYGAVTLQQSSTSLEDECISILSLDDLELEKLDFIKIDAEGMEDKILLGGKQTLTKCKPVFIIEIHSQDVPRVKQLVENLNYKLHQIGGIDFIGFPIPPTSSTQ